MNQDKNKTDTDKTVHAKHGRRGKRTREAAGETAIFQSAAALLHITPTAYAPIFGVTRQTVAKWMRGETRPKPHAFVILTRELVREARSAEELEKRMADQDERLAAAKRQAEEIRADLDRIKRKAGK